jgi:hypothetical protein
MFRTDSHRNPTAFTTDIARQAGLVEGVDYEQGDPFGLTEQAIPQTLNWLGTGLLEKSPQYHTARLLGDPIALTIKVIDAIGFTTHAGYQRWTYINLPKMIWYSLPDISEDNSQYPTKKDVIGFMYSKEGGTEMLPLFTRIIR